jgi:tripartite-type tricarboxylate transporter receptor subunit TctC
VGSTPEAFHQYLSREMDRWDGVAKSSNLQVQ